MMAPKFALEQGRHEPAGREPSALALAIIAALTLAISTDQLDTASSSASPWQQAEPAESDHDTTPDHATA